VIGGERLNGKCDPVFIADKIRQREHLRRRDRAVLGVGSDTDSSDAHSWFEVRDLRTNGVDNPRSLQPWNIGELRLHQILSLAEQSIGKVNADRVVLDSYPSLARLGDIDIVKF